MLSFVCTVATQVDQGGLTIPGSVVYQPNSTVMPLVSDFLRPQWNIRLVRLLLLHVQLRKDMLNILMAINSSVDEIP